MNIEKEREALVAEIEIFIAEAMKAYVVERWAGSYQNTEPFAYTIDAKNEVWWMKTQAHQLWKFWKAAKADEAKKLEGCVVVPVEPTEAMYLAGVTTKTLNGSTLDVWTAMLEAARGGNE